MQDGPLLSPGFGGGVAEDSAGPETRRRFAKHERCRVAGSSPGVLRPWTQEQSDVLEVWRSFWSLGLVTSGHFPA